MSPTANDMYPLASGSVRRDELHYLRMSRTAAAVSVLLVAGVMALHCNHVIHRDLKPSNVMVGSEGNVVVFDFGLVMEASQIQSSFKFFGNYFYSFKIISNVF